MFAICWQIVLNQLRNLNQLTMTVIFLYFCIRKQRTSQSRWRYIQWKAKKVPYKPSMCLYHSMLGKMCINIVAFVISVALRLVYIPTWLHQLATIHLRLRQDFWFFIDLIHLICLIILCCLAANGDTNKSTGKNLYVWVCVSECVCMHVCVCEDLCMCYYSIIWPNYFKSLVTQHLYTNTSLKVSHSSSHEEDDCV